MFKLIFFTTNKIKLAHARHLAEKYPVTIESFRRKTFYASYKEPVIDSREDLLKQSYESALEQAKNSGINTDKRFFFLEDTSVRIDCLSTSETEIPGVNVKYWMKDITFEALDKLLSEEANRNVIVRSDILLHIPSYYQKKWGIEAPYLVFVGVQKGKVVAEEQEFKTNLIFPWLDNKTFNKWFVPGEELLPISCLPIDVANKYDFRGHAFSKMIEFLTEHGVFEQSYEQQSLDLIPPQNDTPPTLIICGFPCAGKTTLAQHLVRELGYVHIEASDFMYLNFYLRHDIGSDIKISDFAEEALKEIPEIAAQKIAEYMHTLDGLPIVISGFRSLREIEWIKKHFDNDPIRHYFVLGFIEVNQKLRFERCNKRKRDGQEISEDRFKTQDEQQIRMGLNEISQSSSKTTIMNEGTLQELHEQTENLFHNPNMSEPNTDIDFSIFRGFSDNIGLEFPILIALLSRWEDREDRSYFTTTQIAKLINEIFPSMKPKYKDNVSRYFNQDFYAFYEIDPDPDENKRKYRLSNTGYGRAVNIYHQLRRK